MDFDADGYNGSCLLDLFWFGSDCIWIISLGRRNNEAAATTMVIFLGNILRSG
jgi:hypothetical protein